MTRYSLKLRGGLAALVLAGAPACVEAEPADAHLPIQGDVSGALKIAALPELGLEWRVALMAGTITLTSQRPGVDLALELRPTGEGVWRWAIIRGALDVAELWPNLRQRIAKAAEGWSASGRIELSGAGAWSPDAGPTGELRMILRDGWARSDALDVELSGLELEATTSDLAHAVLAPVQILRVGKISSAGAELGALRLVFGLEAGQVFQLAEGEANFLGGRVRLRPFRMPLSNPAVDAAADVDSIRLEEAARLLPWLVQSAQGRLRGRVELTWDGAKGLRVRDGGLEIAKTDDAAFRLAPSPGLLTGKMPVRFALLPWDWARWVSINNPSYAPLRDIELGRVGLQIESFQVEFRPDGANMGRTAAVHIVGRPTGGDWVRQVKLDINFHGPWSEFLSFGLNNDFGGASFRLE